jgi:hypothetical protein
MVMARARVVTVVILVCSIWMLIEIGFLRGTKGSNSNGSGPRLLPEGTPFRTKSAAIPTNQAPERAPPARMR